MDYETDGPVRVMLIPGDESELEMQVLLSSNTNGARQVRIRRKDFRPMPYADIAAIAAADNVGGSYMENVTGLMFSSAGVNTDTIHFKINQIVVYGADGKKLKQKAPRRTWKNIVKKPVNHKGVRYGTFQLTLPYSEEAIKPKK